MSSMTTQKQAVVDAVVDVLGTSFVSGTTVVSQVITADQKALVRSQVFDAIVAGTVQYNKDVTDTAATRRYVNSMVDNHFRRALSLNGGTAYRPANSGGRRDSQLKEMTTLRSNFAEGTPEYIEISTHMSLRVEEIAVEKAEKKAASVTSTINEEALPEHLRGLVSGTNNQ